MTFESNSYQEACLSVAASKIHASDFHITYTLAACLIKFTAICMSSYRLCDTSEFDCSDRCALQIGVMGLAICCLGRAYRQRKRMMDKIPCQKGSEDKVIPIWQPQKLSILRPCCKATYGSWFYLGETMVTLYFDLSTSLNSLKPFGWSAETSSVHTSVVHFLTCPARSYHNKNTISYVFSHLILMYQSVTYLQKTYRELPVVLSEMQLRWQAADAAVERLQTRNIHIQRIRNAKRCFISMVLRFCWLMGSQDRFAADALRVATVEIIDTSMQC